MGSSPSQIAKSINDLSAASITRSLQSSTGQDLNIVSFNASCPPTNNPKNLCLQSCKDYLTKNPDVAKECMKDVCAPICSVTNVDIEQRFTLNTTSKFKNVTDQQVQDTINSKIAQLSKDSSEPQKVKLENNSHTSIASDIKQVLNQKSINRIDVNIRGVQIKSFKIKQVVDITRDILLQNENLQEQITNISSSIYQSSSGSYDWIVKAGAILIAVLILTFFVVAFNKSSDFKDFLKTNAAYLIFLSLVLIITIVHVLLKPAYVSYVDPKSKEKKLMSGKLALYMILYCFAIGIILAIVFKIIKKDDSTPTNSTPPAAETSTS